jgi:hypothetical protein
MDYSGAVKGAPKINSIPNIIKLLTDLLVAITTTDDPKVMLTTTINSFISILAQQ